jgi:hypothetical protein
MDGGAMAQNQQVINDASQSYVNYYLGEGASQGIYKDGGAIPNNYEGRTPEDVWNNLSVRQREHFLHDHNQIIVYYVSTDPKVKSGTLISDLYSPFKSKSLNYSKLNKYAKQVFEEHIENGQYAKGGAIENQYKDRTPKDIWDSLTKAQRGHFIHDHTEEIAYDKGMEDLPAKDIIEGYNSDYKNLDFEIKFAFNKHVSIGQYASGGSLGKALYVAYSSYFDYNKYDEEKIMSALKSIGAKNIRLEKQYDNYNHPEVVVFNGNKRQAEDALNEAFDTDYILVYEKDWRAKKMADGGSVGDVSGNYYSTTDFVSQNDLMDLAKSTFGQDWESGGDYDYDTEEIKMLVKKLGGGYKIVYVDSEEREKFENAKSKYLPLLKNKSNDGDIFVIPNKKMADGGFTPDVSDGTQFMSGVYANGGGVGSSFNDSVADKMEKISTMKSFASKVRGMKTPITREQLSDMLPDYVSGKDITEVLAKKMADGGFSDDEEDVHYDFGYGDKLDLGGGRVRWFKQWDGDKMIVVGSREDLDSDLGSYAYPSNVQRVIERYDEDEDKDDYANGGGVGSSFNDSVADKMEKISTMKSFASKVRGMKTPITREQLNDMLPDYVSGKDITEVLAYKMADGGFTDVKKGSKFKNDIGNVFVIDEVKNGIVKYHSEKYGKEQYEDDLERFIEIMESQRAVKYANGGFTPDVSDGTQFMSGVYAKGGALNKENVKVGDVLMSTTGVKVKVTEFDPLFGGRVRAIRLDKYGNGKESQFMSLSKFTNKVEVKKTKKELREEFLEDVSSQVAEVWDKIGADSGGTIRTDDKLLKGYAQGTEEVMQKNGVKKGSFNQSDYNYYVDGNDHLLNDFLVFNGYYNSQVTKAETNWRMKQFDEAMKQYGKSQYVANPNIVKVSAKLSSSTTSSSKLKKYIDNADINFVVLKIKGKTVTISGSDVLNGANLLEDGGDLTKIAFYVPKRDVVEVILKNGETIKPVNGYWVKKGYEPITRSSTPKTPAKGKVTSPNYPNVNFNHKVVINGKTINLALAKSYVTGLNGSRQYDFIDVDGNPKTGYGFSVKEALKQVEDFGNNPIYYSQTTNTSAKTDETKAHFKMDVSGGGKFEVFVDSNFINQSKGNLPNSELKHYGFGEFYLETPDGNIDFIRTSEDKKGFVGRTHKMKGSDELVLKLINAMKEKGKFESTQTFANGGFTPNVSDGTQFMSGVYADGGMTGSDYMNSPQFEALREKFDRLHFAVKSKVVIAVGLDSAIDFYDADLTIAPYRFLERAVTGNLISLDEINQRLIDSAMEEAEEISNDEDLEEIGSSDFTYYLQHVLDGAGFKVGFVGSKLERLNEDGSVKEIENNFADGGFMNGVYAKGGDLSDVDLNFDFETEGDAELEYPQEVEKIKLLKGIVNFDEVRGAIDYGKTKDNTNLQFYKKGKLVMTLKGDYDVDAEILDTEIDILGIKHKINYHPYDSMGGIDFDALKRELDKASFADGGFMNGVYAKGGVMSDGRFKLRGFPPIDKAELMGLYDDFQQNFSSNIERFTKYYNKVHDSKLRLIDVKELMDYAKLKFSDKMADGGFMNEKYNISFNYNPSNLKNEDAEKIVSKYTKNWRRNNDFDEVSFFVMGLNKEQSLELSSELKMEDVYNLEIDKSKYANGGMFDDNDGFMRADNNNNYRYPEMEVYVETLDEPIDLTSNVSSKTNNVVIQPLNEDIDLSDDNRVKARMTQSNKGSAKDFAKINPRAFEFIEELPMPTSHLHKND